MNAIDVRNLTINYKYMTKSSFRTIFNQNSDKNNVFTAVNDISFQVETGDIMGIIGRNGSGKSTLLKAIAGVFNPNAGVIDLHGNSVSLLALGIGFRENLSGRENIYLSGMLLGYTEAIILKKIQEIIEFSEIDDFIDRPVRTYSSGMYSKLAFSINIMLATDIILIDEVLSVGDKHFSKKSYNKMKELIRDKDRTVLMVSHSISALTDLCNKVMWMNDGVIVRIGETKDVIDEYVKFMEK